MTYFIVFGEDDSDRRSLAHLIRAICKDNSIKISLLQRPIVLSRNAVASGKRRVMSKEIAGFYRAYTKSKGTTWVVVHRDCDAVEPAHVVESEALENELKAEGIKHPIAATPAWEIETWWMLFPDAVSQVRHCWRQIDYKAKSVGEIANSKERLTSDLSPRGNRERARCPDYREADGIKIAENLTRNPEIIDRKIAKSDSFELFREKILKTLAS